MPLEDFLSVVMNLLQSQPGAGEILVEGVKFLRCAEANGHYDEVPGLFSAH